MRTLLRISALPLIACVAALVVLGVGAWTSASETAVPRVTKPDAFAGARLIAPAPPGSYAVSPIGTLAEGVRGIDGLDCVARLKAAIEPLKITFAQGTTVISPDKAKLLTQISDQISGCRDAYVMVAGHADGSGSDEMNMALSWARADNALNRLVAAGVNPSAIEAVGYGATTPLAQGSDTEDPADRRVEFHVFRLHRAQD
ncbi:MAG: OmpA family protein [Pseudomonadota bacterium]